VVLGENVEKSKNRNVEMGGLGLSVCAMVAAAAIPSEPIARAAA
jgi:hypothetical protein